MRLIHEVADYVWINNLPASGRNWQTVQNTPPNSLLPLAAGSERLRDYPAQKHEARAYIFLDWTFTHSQHVISYAPNLLVLAVAYKTGMKKHIDY